MTSMVTEPGLNPDGRRLLYRIRRLKLPYPLAFYCDQRGAVHALAGGYVKTLPDNPRFVTLTDKGEAYLDRLLRCE